MYWCVLCVFFLWGFRFLTVRSYRGKNSVVGEVLIFKLFFFQKKKERNWAIFYYFQIPKIELKRFLVMNKRGNMKYLFDEKHTNNI